MNLRLKATVERINQGSDMNRPDAELIAAKIRALMVGYDKQWGDVPYVIEAKEEEFHVPIVNPETGGRSQTFTHAGKRDGVVRFEPSGKRYLLEHKTTIEDVRDPGSTYFRRLVIDSQVSSYMLASWQEGQSLDGTLYDVIRKPTIRPKKLAKKDTKLLIQHGEYCGFQIPKEHRLLDTENSYLYECRLLRDILDAPDKYFARRPVPRMESELVEHANELWDVAKTILDARKNGRHYRNSDACMTYGSPCEYLGVCSGNDDFNSDRWVSREQRHSELSEFADGGLSVLTNSRIKCFQTCRRKHFYRYEQGFKKDDGDREPRYFGALMHDALETWWSFQKGTDNDDFIDSPTGGDSVSHRLVEAGAD